MNGRKLHYLSIVAVLAFCAESVFACANQPPVAQIDHSQTDWEIFVTPATYVVLDGSDSYDPDGYIQEYHWTITRWNGSYYAYYDEVESYSSVSGYRFWDPGSYQVELEVVDNGNTPSYYPDSSWVLVADVTIDDCDESLALGGTGEAQIDYTLEPEDGGFRPTVDMIVKNASGGFVRYMSLDDDLGSQSAFWDGKDNSGQWVPAGTYTIFIEMSVAYVNTFSDSTQIDVYEVDVDIDSPSFPAYVAVNEWLHLDSSYEGQVEGDYYWTQDSGPGSVTFSPNQYASDPDFKANQPGNYLVTVMYSEAGTQVSEQSGTITVYDIGITSPSFPAYVAAGTPLQLDSTPTDDGSGSYYWTKESGPGQIAFSNSFAQDPTFTASTPGNYTVRVNYTRGGTTCSAVSGTITVFDIAITSPSFPAYFHVGTSIQLDSTPSDGGDGSYYWVKESGPGGASLTNAFSQDPTFAATVPGAYTVRVNYTHGGTPYSVVSGSIFAYDVEIDSPPYIPREGATLECTAYGLPYATLEWSKVDGPGDVSFIPNANAEDPEITVTVPGLYTFRVEYSSPGLQTISDEADVCVFGVEIDSASYIPEDAATLECTGYGLPSASYQWSKVSGPGDVSFIPNASTEDPEITVTVPGIYTFRVEYSSSGFQTVSDEANICVFGVDIGTPGTPTAYVDINDLALDVICDTEPNTGGTIAWTVTEGPSGWSFAAPAERSTTFSATAPGVYQLQVEYGLPGGPGSASTTDTCTVVAMDVTIDDCNDYLSYQGTTPANISYTVEPNDYAGSYSVELRVKDQSDTVVRTQDLTSLGLGSQQTTWDGKLDDGVTDAAPGQYTMELAFIAPGEVATFTDAYDITVVGIVIDNDWPDRDTDSYFTYDPCDPAMIYYTIEPNNATFDPNIYLVIKDAAEDTIGTRLLSDGLGPQQASWDGADPNGNPVPAGLYTLTVEMDYAGLTCSASQTATLIYVTIDTCSNYVYGSTTSANISYTIEPNNIPFDPSIHLEVKDVNNVLIRRELLPDLLGSQTTAWNGRDDADSPVPPGQYLATVVLERGGMGAASVSTTRDIADSTQLSVDQPPDVEIIKPAPGTRTYVAPGGQVDVECTASGGRGSVEWSPAEWFDGDNEYLMSTHLHAPSTPGNYHVSVTYGGNPGDPVDTEVSGTITVLDVDLNEAATHGYLGSDRTSTPICYAIGGPQDETSWLDDVYILINISDEYSIRRQIVITDIDSNDVGIPLTELWDGKYDGGQAALPGSYTITIYLMRYSPEYQIDFDDSRADYPSEDTGYISVVTTNLNMGIELYEDYPGFFIRVDDDDDNYNCAFDYNDTPGVSTYEDDWYRSWEWTASYLPDGYMKMGLSDTDKIEGWDESVKLDFPLLWDLSDPSQRSDFHNSGLENDWLLRSIAGSEDLRDISVTLSYYWPDPNDPNSLIHQDVVNFTAVKVDLDVDSDNNNGYGDPGRDPNEEYWEPLWPDTPGKYIAINNDDDDADGIPDFADGFTWDGMPDDADSNAPPAEAFVPLILELDKATIANGKVKFSYGGSDPNGISFDPDTHAYTPDSAGRLRIWAKAGNVSRTVADYIVPEQVYEPNQLGFSSGETSVPFYVEAVSCDIDTSPCEISVLVDPDGDGTGAGFDDKFKDSVYITPIWVDMVMSGVNDCQETMPGGLIPKGDMVELTVYPTWPERPGVSGWDDLVLSVEYEGSGEIQVWNEAKNALVIDANTTSSYLFPTEDTFWVEGLETSSDLRDITLVLTHASTGYQDRIKLTVYEVNTVTWETYADNLAIDNHPNEPDNGGERIFPGRKDPNDPNASLRNKVWIRATVMPEIAGLNVYFKWFDIDDPSADGGPLDPLDSPPLGLGPDNRGGPGELSDPNALTDASGMAKVLFSVGMQPGDNYRIGASCSQRVIDVEVNQLRAELAIEIPGAKFSPMLTVWRKLWLERDSMAAPPDTGNEKNYVAGTATDYEPYQPPPIDRTWIHLGTNLPDEFDDENQFQDGAYVTSAKSYDVRANTAYSPYGEDKAKVKGDPNTDGVPKEYKLYDDDDPNVLSQSPALGTWESVFHSAYIAPDYLPSSYSSTVPFVLNMSASAVSWGTGAWNDSYDVHSEGDFWTELVVGGFQPETNKDADPITELLKVFGDAKSHGDDNQCMVYLEVIRDFNIIPAGKCLAHEVGHGAGIEDDACEDGCIMVRGANGTGDHFCDECLLEMRKDANY